MMFYNNPRDVPPQTSALFMHIYANTRKQNQHFPQPSAYNVYVPIPRTTYIILYPFTVKFIVQFPETVVC